MNPKDKCDIRQIFINLTNARGLLWPDIVEGILFDKNGFLRYGSSDVKIDELSLVTILVSKNIDEIINYVLVLDYLVDYLKNMYDLHDIEISTLLKGYLTDCNIVKFEKLEGPIGSWIIPLDIVVNKDLKVFEQNVTDIIIWIINKRIKYRNKEYLFLKQLLKEKDKSKNIIYLFVENLDKESTKELLQLESKDNDKVFSKFMEKLKEFINEKKNSPTSS